MTTHDLKVWPEFFDALERNEKQFEVRWDDRGYKVGDTLLLREWSPQVEGYSGREIRRNVYYVMQGGKFGIAPGYVVLSIS